MASAQNLSTAQAETYAMLLNMGFEGSNAVTAARIYGSNVSAAVNYLTSEPPQTSAFYHPQPAHTYHPQPTHTYTDTTNNAPPPSQPQPQPPPSTHIAKNEEQGFNYQQCQYEYEEEYEDQYEDWNDYDDCDYDPRTNKITVTTYTSDKKPKHKTDPLAQSRQNAMRMVHKINSYNERKSRHTYKGNNNLYFVIVINGKQLFIGSIRGNHTNILYSNKNNFKAGKHNKGGQSAQRFGRIYDNKINSFIKQCVMKINKLCDNHSNGIILAGNGSMKNKLFQSKDLNQNTVKSHIIEIVNTQNGGKDGFMEIFQKIKNNQLFKKNGFENKSDIIIIKDVMALIEDDNKCDMISIGIQETIKAIKLKIIKYVVLTKYYKYVIKKKSKPIKFIRNDTELHESIESLKINISKKNKTWRIVDYVQYVRNLCSINNVELKIIRDNSENSKKFSNDLSGCVGVLYQSFEYLKDSDTQ